MPTLYHHIYGFSIFNTLTEVLHEIVSIIQVIPSFFVFNKPLEIPSYIPLFSQCVNSLYSNYILAKGGHATWVPCEIWEESCKLLASFILKCSINFKF